MAHVIIGGKPIAVVSLETPQEQAQGFQNYKSIPDNYCLKFPRCGSHAFHMMNVGAPLLMVATDDKGVVVGKEIRQPETMGKRVSGNGVHIYEFHPKFEPHVNVGSLLEEQREREAQSQRYVLGYDPSGPYLKLPYGQANAKPYSVPTKEQATWFKNQMEATWAKKLPGWTEARVIPYSPDWKRQAELSPSEAVFGFAGWLTTRDNPVTMGSTNECGQVAELVGKFVDQQKLEDPRDHWEKDLVPMREAQAKPFTIAVDLDDTILEYDEWKGEDHFGEPKPGAKQKLTKLKDEGCKIIIHTCRGNITGVEDVLEKNEIPFDFINENDDQPEGGSDKPIADVYLDDKAIKFKSWDQAYRAIEKAKNEKREGIRIVRSLRMKLAQTKRYEDMTPLTPHLKKFLIGIASAGETNKKKEIYDAINLSHNVSDLTARLLELQIPLLAIENTLDSYFFRKDNQHFEGEIPDTENDDLPAIPDIPLENPNSYMKQDLADRIIDLYKQGYEDEARDLARRHYAMKRMAQLGQVMPTLKRYRQKREFGLNGGDDDEMDWSQTRDLADDDPVNLEDGQEKLGQRKISVYDLEGMSDEELRNWIIDVWESVYPDQVSAFYDEWESKLFQFIKISKKDWKQEEEGWGHIKDLTNRMRRITNTILRQPPYQAIKPNRSAQYQPTPLRNYMVQSKTNLYNADDDFDATTDRQDDEDPRPEDGSRMSKTPAEQEQDEFEQ